MNRRQALAKATVDTASIAGGLLDPQQSAAFRWKIREQNNWLSMIGYEERSTDTGTLDTASIGTRIIRGATENSDDGYRAGMAVGEQAYTARKIRLPWEVTEDVFHQNIEREALEDRLTGQMTAQFGADLADLSINGDTADVSADAPFLTINDGFLKLITAAAGANPARNINGATIAGGVFGKAHMFEALYARPNKYAQAGGFYWLMSTHRAIQYWESLTDRATAAGDALLAGQTASQARAPLGVPIAGQTVDGTFIPGIPGWPDHTVMLARPKNFVRVNTWDVRKRRVTGETDSSLAARDKRFYIFFIKEDYVVQEYDEVIRIYGLAAV